MNTTACVRGCTRWGKHLPDGCNPDQCQGCEPRLTHIGLLCRRCLTLLDELLDGPHNPESVAGVCLWLGDNLGQHVRHSNGSGGRGNSGDTFVNVQTARRDLEIFYAECAIDFAEDRHMAPPADHRPTTVASHLRPWTATLAAWEPIADTIYHLVALRRSAHAVCPWRGKDPNAGEAAAALLYLAPAEPTDDICARFGVTPGWLWQQKRRRRLAPQIDGVKPLWWRPWDVFEVLHPEEARRHEGRMAGWLKNPETVRPHRLLLRQRGQYG